MKYGIVGLGMMGRAIAGRLAERQYDLVVYNRTHQKAERFQERYGREIDVVDSPAVVAQRADVLFSMVADSQALESIVWGEGGLLHELRAGQIWIDASTVSPNLSRRVSKAVEERQAIRLEAPVSGSVDAAENGTLLMFVAGSQEHLDAVRPMLSAFTRQVEWIGATGQALALKLAMNLNIAVQLQGFLEGMMIAEAEGLPRSTVIPVMLNSVIASPMLKYRVPFAQDPPTEPWFTVRLMLKDLNLALEQANQHGIAMPVTGASADLMRIAVRNGIGEQEVAEMINYVTTLANPSTESPHDARS